MVGKETVAPGKIICMPTRNFRPYGPVLRFKTKMPAKSASDRPNTAHNKGEPPSVTIIHIARAITASDAPSIKLRVDADGFSDIGTSMC